MTSGIAEKYDVWSLEKRVINGDGAPWISSECEEDADCTTNWICSTYIAKQVKR